MKGDTHRAGAMAVTDTLRLPLSILYLVARPNFTEVVIYYTIYNTITTQATKVGAVLPDYDQASWRYSPNELYEPIGKFYFKFLKRIKAKHRSTHTHNLDGWTILLGIPSMVLYGLYLSRLNPIFMVSSTIMFILYTSILSHQFLDTLTYQGTYQSHIKTMIKGSSKGRKRTSIVPINKVLYEMIPLHIGKWRTPLSRPVKTKIESGEWGKTGDGAWEEAILFKLATYLDNRMKIRTYLVEVLILYLLVKVM